MAYLIQLFAMLSLKEKKNLTSFPVISMKSSGKTYTDEKSAMPFTHAILTQFEGIPGMMEKERCVKCVNYWTAGKMLLLHLFSFLLLYLF